MAISGLNPLQGDVGAHSYLLSLVTVPSGLPPSGVINNNGALTLGTGFRDTFSRGIFLYFPANAIFAGSAAGFYWTVMSSATAGTIYNNTYDPSLGLPPVEPDILVPFVSTGSGAYTSPTGISISLTNYTIAANSLPDPCMLQVQAYFTFPSNTNYKYFTCITGSDPFVYGQSNYSGVTGTTMVAIGIINNGIMRRSPWATPGFGNDWTVSPAYLSFSSSSSHTIQLQGKLATATDYIIAVDSLIKVIPS